MKKYMVKTEKNLYKTLIFLPIGGRGGAGMMFEDSAKIMEIQKTAILRHRLDLQIGGA